MRRSLTVLGLLALLPLLVAACGDDTLSDEAYFAALEAESADAAAQGEAVFERLIGDVAVDDPESVVAFLDAFRATWEDTRATTAALTPPSDLATAHDALVEALDAVIEELGVAVAEAEAGNVDTFFAIAEPVALAELERACAALERLGRDRDIHVSLACADLDL